MVSISGLAQSRMYLCTSIPFIIHAVRGTSTESRRRRNIWKYTWYSQNFIRPVTWSMTTMLETVGTWLVLADHYLLSSVSARSPGPRTADRIQGRLPSLTLPSTFATVGTLATARPPRSAMAGGRARGLPSYSLLGWRMRTRRPHSHERAPTTRKSYLIIAR
jgi:hypothetical protein